MSVCSSAWLWFWSNALQKVECVYVCAYMSVWFDAVVFYNLLDLYLCVFVRYSFFLLLHDSPRRNASASIFDHSSELCLALDLCFGLSSRSCLQSYHSSRQKKMHVMTSPLSRTVLMFWRWCVQNRSKKGLPHDTEHWLTFGPRKVQETPRIYPISYQTERFDSRQMNEWIYFCWFFLLCFDLLQFCLVPFSSFHKLYLFRLILKCCTVQ